MYSQAVKEFPGETVFHCYLNEMLRKQNKNREALDQIKPVYQQRGEQDSVSGCYKWSLIAYGLQQREEGKTKEALGMLRDAFFFDREEQTALLWYGILLREDGQLDGSIRILEEGNAKVSNSYIRDNLIHSYTEKANSLRTEDPSTAEGLYRKALELDSKNLTALLWLGIFLNEQARFPEAVETFSFARDIYTEDPHLPGNLNNTYYRFGQELDSKKEYGEATVIYEKASREFPSFLFYYYLLFTDYIQMESYPQAEETLLRWFKAKKDYPPAAEGIFPEEINLYYRIGDLVKQYRIAGEFNRALSLYEKAEPYFENSHLILNGKGELLWHRGETTRGIELVNRAYDLFIQSHPEFSEAVRVDLPLKDRVLVAVGNNSPETLTHGGLARYCFDFMGCDDKGRTTRPGTKGFGENRDYYGYGIPVYAPANGVVLSLEDDGEDHPPTDRWMYHMKGNHITIRDERGYLYVLVHNQNHSALVKAGDQVSAGQPIARLGNTASSVPHLHFGVWKEDWSVTIPVRFRQYRVNGDRGNTILRKDAVPELGEIIIAEP